MMTNEEKKQFIIEAHKLYMERRPYDNNKSFDKTKEKENEFWKTYYSKFGKMIPKSLYKYRPPTKKAIENLENNNAWFSHPIDFDDTVDSTLNNDIEAELDEIDKDPTIVAKKLSIEFIKIFSLNYGVKIDASKIDEMCQLFNLEDGSLKEAEAKKYLAKKLPNLVADNCVEELKKRLLTVDYGELKEPVTKALKEFMSINDKIRSETLSFSVAEEGDNQAMWGLYAKESRGFCIEYCFPKDEFLAQRMILNLFPIYYGSKPQINFLDALIKGIYSANKVGGISPEDYREWFLSAYTKNPTYSFQNEWRITLDGQFGSNIQDFPFARSIILGERISKRTANMLIKIAKEKHITVYQRRYNKSYSKIIAEKIDI